MLDRHITRRMILAPIAGIGAILLSSVPGFAADGPSFDCTHGINSALAIILCSVPEAAQADWDLVSAYWAFSTDDRDQSAFSQSMNQRCALPRQETAEERVGRAFAQEVGRRIWSYTPPVPGPQSITQNHVRCVIAAFHNRAAMLRSKLKGDALAESKLSPEEHIDIQAALIRKGFLRNRFRVMGRMTTDSSVQTLEQRSRITNAASARVRPAFYLLINGCRYWKVLNNVRLA
jgi:hypothetical protein